MCRVSVCVSKCVSPVCVYLCLCPVLEHVCVVCVSPVTQYHVHLVKVSSESDVGVISKAVPNLSS